MNALARLIVGIVWATWGIVPALAVARSALDLLVVYAWCIGAALVGVTILWIATLGARR